MGSIWSWDANPGTFKSNIHIFLYLLSSLLCILNKKEDPIIRH